MMIPGYLNYLVAKGMNWLAGTGYDRYRDVLHDISVSSRHSRKVERLGGTGGHTDQRTRLNRVLAQLTQAECRP